MNWQSQTLNYYDENAAAFIKGTAAADISSTRECFAKLLPPRARILDFGCGSGRDTKAFLELGFQVDATDGSAEICRQASSFTGIDVQHMLFQSLDAVDTYDGIWACASILHLPKAELTGVLHKICRALKPGGIFCGCFYVKGSNLHTDKRIRQFYIKAGFFTEPFETVESLRERLSGMYREVNVTNVQSIAVFQCRKDR